MESLKILIPTDFSVQAEFAYLMVKKLEEKTTIDIHFLHVLNVPDTVTMDSRGDIQTCGEIDVNYVVKQKEIALRKLENLKVLYGSQINVHLVLGKTTDAILDFSNSNSFDLIVMGTKGSSGIKEVLSGSEAQIIARRSKTPLLSLMCDRSDLQIQNVLLVHNFNHPKKEGMELMHKLIKAFNTKVHLLQITSGQVEFEKASVQADMKQFAELNGIENYECHLINDKDVENGVVHFNQMSNMDIICIGTHGKGGLFHQSATEKLINHLFKPIISFHLNN
ncbi:Nucleotide-binding universal stress protein, UspA family [Daejeonella rubra]|uniref:Nucleotide-binding universal stress protein, UspA family n=1 Tax=Daejeonella rubra TaxID=990371 RepID=A0A1G9V7C7_9SPHI|nr:universal stress protein [Daejeonella rubra]SDM68059.1 Nucleotide-binding universal stress protein, UspA family [Daejeonella rubra]